MKKITRGVLTFITVLATFYFTYKIPFSFIPGIWNFPILPFILSLLLAAGIGFLVWKSLGKKTENFTRYVLMGGVITGAILFLAGFIGPMIFIPSSNQGPMLGLFITGPLGFLIGLLGGGIYWWLKVKRVEKKDA